MEPKNVKDFFHQVEKRDHCYSFTVHLAKVFHDNSTEGHENALKN